MAPLIEHYHLMTVFYWLIMLPVAVMILIRVTDYFADDVPATFGRAVLTIVLTAAAVYLAYDLTSYYMVRLLQDPQIGFQLPSAFTCFDWLREPVAVKWQVMGIVPFVRFFPIFIGLFVGGVIQVGLWKVPYVVGLVIFVAQFVLDLVAMLVLSIVFSLGIGIYERLFPEVAGPAGGALAEMRLPEPGRRGDPADLGELSLRVRHLPPEHHGFWRRLDSDWEAANAYLGPLYRLLHPVTRHLPLPLQDFLTSGGWVPVLLGGVVVLRLWPRVHRNRKQFARRQKSRQPAPRILLQDIGDALTGLGPKQVTVNGSKARLRLVILAPKPDGERLSKEVASAALDTLLPGLAEIADSDCPRIEVWNGQHARESFPQVAQKRVQFPEPMGTPSPWVLLLGEIQVANTPLQVGLALFCTPAGNTRVIQVAAGQWPQALALRAVSPNERLFGH